MQGYDSRLRKAASRTIRAEATLVIVILLITSWSVYGLYKLSIGATDSVFGLTFSRAVSNSNSSNQESTSDSSEALVNHGTQRKSQHPTYSSTGDSTNLDQIYQQLSEAQRDNDYASFKGYTSNKSQFRDLGIDPARFRTDAESSSELQPGRQLPKGFENILSFQQRQQRALDLAKQYNQLNSKPILLTGQPSLMQLGPPITKLVKPQANNGDVMNFNLDDDYREESTDRVPAESSHDTAESLAEQNDGDNSKQTSPGEEDQSDVETTTESAAEERDQEDSGANREEKSTAEPEEVDEQPSTTTEEPDRTDDDSLREAGRNIDEEVDRMTQPSSGSTSRQEKPRDDRNTVVQFDDSPSSTPSQAHVPPGPKSIQSVAAEEEAHIKTERFTKEMSNSSLKRNPQVDGDKLLLSTDATSRSIMPHRLEKDNSDTRMKLQARKSFERPTDADTKLNLSAKLRLKRSTGKVETIRAPYEIDRFLESLDFDSLSSQPPVTFAKREPRSMKLHASSPNISEEIMDTDTDENHIDETLFDEDHPSPQNSSITSKRLRLRALRDPMRPIQLEKKTEESSEDQRITNPPSTDEVSGDSRYRYLTTNDTGLQDLLNKTNLLDRYRSDDLPPPIERPPPIPSSDHQAAGSLYSVDHGLLLYPEADEHHHEKTKSISKKHKKSHKMKHKKKMSVGVKKGGHKKKKHKKEMKKFIKEKKFKGAKKGKKVAKGKGGQGGKKGKKLYKDKGFKKKGFKKVYHKEEFGQKKSYFDEYRDKDFKKKWKKYDDKYNYARMKKWQAKDVKGAKKLKDHHEKYKKYDKSKWKKKYEKHSKEHSEKKSKKKKKSHKY